ncbi:hypothetical protein C8J98_102550 [Luteibacter sp. OK325]|uniref:hypothetical protein n=1 Tax=Luteibacter sp. OK325 TaxID=2135670 RepID=UPI000D347232|nr:hypothetical protein [Luteibacter sp. OK325]PTR34362.1 hypothetical protein C8J98_102550 [Luteibacter sp. OK325]
MTIQAFFHSRARSLPFALLFIGMGSWAMSADLPAAPQASAPTTTSRNAMTEAGSIPPYGAISHGLKATPEAILPYGAISPDATATSAAVLPYGAISHDATVASATVLPYGAMGPHAAP